MDPNWTWNLKILVPELATVPPTVYFLFIISIMMTFAITVIILSAMFDGTFKKFVLKWGIFTAVLNAVLLTNDLLHIFIFK